MSADAEAVVTWNDVGLAYVGTWPQAQMNKETLGLFCNELSMRGVSPDDALLAIRSSVSQFPPSAAALGTAALKTHQGPPPSFTGAFEIIGRKIGLLAYHDPMSTWDKFVAAVSVEHEAVGRFLVAVGSPDLIRRMPDPRYAQDTGGSVELTRLEREYSKSVDEWNATPTPGLALEEARRRQVAQGGSMGDVVEGLRPAAQISAGA